MPVDEQVGSEPTPPATNPQPSRLRRMIDDRDPVLLVVIMVALVGFCLVCFFGVLLVRESVGGTNEDGETTEGEQGFLSGWFRSGSSAQETPEPLVTLANPFIDVSIAGTSPLTLTLQTPTFVRVGGRDLPVTVDLSTDDEAWVAQNTGGDTAVWLYGSVVNYIFGLPDNNTNRALLNQLNPGDRLIFRTRGETQLEFNIIGRELTDRAIPELFSQQRPGVTIILRGGATGAERLVVRGEYVVAETGRPDSLSNVLQVELGEPAQIGNARFTVTGATHAVDQPGAPPGFSLYFVDFNIENLGTVPVDSGLFRLMLRDDFGNQYSLNSQASQLGNNPILAGFINTANSGEAQRAATAGYQIPSTLNSPSLTWVVTRVDSPGQIEVIIPFRAQDAAQNVFVSLQEATVSPDGTSLTIIGQLSNQGQRPVVVSETDLSLRTDATTYFILSTSPNFPWTVGPGQALPFVLRFQRPDTPTATFAVLNQSFQLSGLR